METHSGNETSGGGPDRSGAGETERADTDDGGTGGQTPGPVGPSLAHEVYPLDAHENVWKCRACATAFTVAIGFAICPNDPGGNEKRQAMSVADFDSDELWDQL